MAISLRRFERRDIPRKVEWINDPANNRYLHYDLPLTVEKTERWFDSHRGDTTRYDAVIEADGVPVGLIGLLSIDRKNAKAEYYIVIGDSAYKGKGVAKEASRLILRYAFDDLKLNRVYLYTETGNLTSQKLYETVGFEKEGVLRQDVFSRGMPRDRYVYACLRERWTHDGDSDSGTGRL